MIEKHPHKGKTAVITGSTSGIGLGIAKALAATGANIVVNGLGDPEAIDSAVNQIRAVANASVSFFAADLRRPEDISSMIKGVLTEYGSVDILVNNAGIQYVSPIEKYPPEKWDEILAVNLSSAFHTTRLTVPSMIAAGWGRIVNVASAHALVASPYKSAYVAAKHGLAGLTKTVALELADRNITVNAVAPGYVQTPLVSSQIADTAKSRSIPEEEVLRNVVLAAHPTKKLIEVDEVASLVRFLCEESASSITGAIFSIDGGWTAQ